MTTENWPSKLPVEWQEYLSARGINPPVAAARGYRAVCSGKTDGSGEFAADYGFPKTTGGLLIPLHALSGGKAYQLRVRDVDATIDAKGKRRKFRSPKGQSPVIDVPPCVWDGKDGGQLLYEDVLFIVEGTTRADALASIGVPSVAIQGVDSWRSRRSGALPDLKDLPLRGKRVAFFPDGDVDTNPTVNTAVQSFGNFLYRYGVESVHVSALPTDEGLDDWVARLLAEGNSPEEVRGQLSSITVPYVSMKQLRDFAKDEALKDNRPFLETAERDWDSDENMASLVLKHYASDLMIVYSEGKLGVHTHTIYWLDGDGVWLAEPATLRMAVSQSCGDAILESFGREDAPRKELHKLLLRVRSSSGQRAIIDAMPGTAARLAPEVPFVHRSELNQPAGYIGLRNGVWNLRTSELVDKDAARKALITSRMPVTYVPDAAEHRAVVQMLESYGEGEPLLLAHLGRTLYKEPGEHWLLIHGDADSGKSTLITSVSRMMGPACKPMMPEALMRARESRTHNSSMEPLFSSAIAYCEEVGGASFGSALREGAVLKDVTGGMGTHGNFSEKGAPGLDMAITATIMMTCNRLPAVGLNDTAMAKRLRLFRTNAHKTVDPTVRAELLVLDGPAQRYFLRLIMKSARDNSPGTPLTDDHHKRPEWMHKLVDSASSQERSEFDEWASIAIVADATELSKLHRRRLTVEEVWDAWCAHNSVDDDRPTTKEVNGVQRKHLAKILAVLGLVPQPEVLRSKSGKSARGWYDYRLLPPNEWPEEPEPPTEPPPEPEEPPCSAQWVDEKNDRGASWKRCPQHNVTWHPDTYPYGRPSCQKKGQAQ